jgi:diguanylate cyclase (GGDEF)-like protein
MMRLDELRDAKVLVVDDNPNNLDVLIEHLEGFDVCVALNGEDALALAARARPEVVLLDIQMPGMDGFETCRRLKQQASFEDVPVIFLTAMTDVEYTLKGFEVGGVDFITKPPHFEEVIARLRTHLTITRQREKLEAQKRELERLAMTDYLTQLPNRRAFQETAEKECARAGRSGKPFSLLLADIDHFKNVNDTHGHEGGDVILRDLATLLRGALRKSDHLARWGGEEFIALLPETGLEGALSVADQLRRLVAEATIPLADAAVSITITIGVSECCKEATLHECIKAADDALYRGKTGGRDQVVSTGRT